MPNVLAYLALFVWLPITVLAFKRYSPPVAAAGLFIFGSMFLPQVAFIKVPVIPELFKEHLLSLYILLALFLFHRKWLRAQVPGGRLGGPLMAIIFICWIFTGYTNGEPVHVGRAVRPALSAYDGFHEALRSLIEFGIPFLIGRKLFREAKDLVVLLKLICLGALVYSLFALWEIRMSPQLHYTFYGVFPNEFTTVRRYGGWRPLLFMESGIAVGQFFMMAAVSAAALHSLRQPVFKKISAKLALPYLLMILVLVKSTAAILYGVVFVFIIKAFKPSAQGKLALGFALIILAYPTVRIIDAFPYEVVLEQFYEFNAERAWSMEYRFQNEDNLVERAMEKPLFGWGTYGRNRIYEARTGKDLSATDGFWISALGSRGLINLYATLLLLLLPVIRAVWNLGRIPGRDERVLIAGVCLVIVARAVDLLPNGWYTSFPLVLSGALFSVVPTLIRSSRMAMTNPAANAAANPAAKSFGAQYIGAKDLHASGQSGAMAR